MAGNLDVNDFLSISFTHHDEILSKTSTLEERVGQWELPLMHEA